MVGLGASGMSAARLLQARGARVAVSDSRSEAEIDDSFRRWLGSTGCAAEWGGHNESFLLQSDCIVVSPGVPLELPVLATARQQGIPIFGEMGLACQFVGEPIVAVTGTNGKSTVVRLLGDIFARALRKVFVGGNIGTPVADYVLAGDRAEVLVLEVSSFQLDSIGLFKPQVAILLNISPDHLDRYPDNDAYIQSKMRIFSDQESNQIAIVNGDDPTICAWPEKLPGHRLAFSNRVPQTSATWLEGSTAVYSGGQTDGQRERYKLPPQLLAGPNPANAMAAILAARQMSCPPAAIAEALADFSPLAHRMTPVAEIDDVFFIDDSKATNIGAVEAALQSISRPVILIAGGRDKRGGYSQLANAVREKVKAMVLIGEAREAMAAAFASMCRIELAADMEEAVQTAMRQAAPGDIVLLSPACASFDMYSSYAHRGRVFQEAVRQLKTRLAARTAAG